MKRLFDITLSIILITILFIPIIIISFAIKLNSRGPAIYWSKRVGINNKYFFMPKLRTMRLNTPTTASHLLMNADNHITSIGKFLRKSSIDELPQIMSILIGDMSFVGPRPALFNQYDLINLRTLNNIHLLKPGITGWAQINGRDFLNINEKVNFDIFYLKNKTFIFDLYIIIYTIFYIFNRRNIKH